MEDYSHNSMWFITSNKYKPLADHLFDLQYKANPPMGVSCVRTIVTYLRIGDINSAKAVARNESDKLWQYPELRKFIHDELEPIGYQDPETGKFVYTLTNP